MIKKSREYVRCEERSGRNGGGKRKFYTQSAISESSIARGRLNLTFLPLRLALWNLAHLQLFTMFMATKARLRFFALGRSYDLSKSNKTK